MTYSFILFEKVDKVGIITLNRPEVLNALSEGLIQELNNALEKCENDSNIHCLILTGSEKAFAAGADIKEMHSKSFMDTYLEDFIKKWEKVATCRKPIIAAVSGYALGGGCEIAMMCDFIIASETAQFRQPEVTIGTMPGAGGTQRLARSAGKSMAMDMCLTGRRINAEEALRIGLVSRVVPVNQLREEVLAAAQKIASYSLPVVMMIKESVNRAFETGISEGLRFERRLFHSTFALEDQKEGMQAFLEKRLPQFKGN
jgi:enoyl-CoA hydratase